MTLSESIVVSEYLKALNTAEDSLTRLQSHLSVELTPYRLSVLVLEVSGREYGRFLFNTEEALSEWVFRSLSSFEGRE